MIEYHLPKKNRKVAIDHVVNFANGYPNSHYRPKVRDARSVRNLNTLTNLVINAKALQLARSIITSLLSPIRHRE
jgi:hypothetical protein